VSMVDPLSRLGHILQHMARQRGHSGRRWDGN
jgi:hypothetical protein